MTMGGLLLFKDGSPHQVLCYQRFSNLLDAGAIDFPFITTQDITSGSRSHPVFAGIVVLQVIWFISQCISRLAQGLPITQLELLSLVLVTLNISLLPFWWYKPLDARLPIRIDLRTTAEVDIVNAGIHAPSAYPILEDSWREKLLMKRMFESDSPLVLGRKRTQIRQLAHLIFKSIKWLLEKLYIDFTGLAFALDFEITDGALSVPRFYGPTNILDRHGITAYVGAGIVGFLHSLAHYFFKRIVHFPTHHDEAVWHAASYAGTIVSGVYLASLSIVIVSGLIKARHPGRGMDILFGILMLVMVPMFSIGLPVLVGSRIALFVVSFRCLNSLPAGALQVVPWTNYIVHFS